MGTKLAIFFDTNIDKITDCFITFPVSSNVTYDHWAKMKRRASAAGKDFEK